MYSFYWKLSYIDSNLSEIYFQISNWQYTAGKKPLHEPMMTQFTDA